MQSRQTSRKVAIRHGSIRGPGFSAIEYRGSNPAFKGRIAVERGSGMVEFPSPSQLRRILREEGIAASAADAAFGHMRGSGQRRTSRKPKKNGGPKSTVISAREGLLQLLVTDESGQSRRIQFAAYSGKDERLRGTVLATEMDRGHRESIIRQQDIESTMEAFGVPSSTTKKVFRHLLTGRVQAPLATALSTYGGRNTAIGHMGVVGGLAMPVAGLRRGSLLAFVKPTKHIIVNFEANDGDTKNEKPIRWGREWSGGDSPGGRAATWDEAYRKAQEFGIPEEAFLRAFGYMVSAKRRRQIAASLAQSASGKIFEPE